MAIERNLVYRISVAGQAEAAAQIRSIMAGVRKLSDEEIALARSVAARKGKVLDDEARHATGLRQVQIRLEKERVRQEVRAAEKAERDKLKAAQVAAKAKTAAEKTEAKLREQLVRGEGKAAEAAKKAEAKAFERAEKDKTAAAKRESRERVKDEEWANRAAMASARVRIAETQKAMSKAQRDAEQRMRDLAFDSKRFRRGVMTSAIDGGFGAVKTVAGMVGGGVRSIAAGAGLTDAIDVSGIVRERLSVQQTLRAVAIEARTAGSQFGQVDEKAALRRVGDISKRTGFSQEDLTNAINVYSEKGSGVTGLRDLEKIAQQARAMGTDPGTVAKLRATIEQSAGTAGQKMSPADLDNVVAQMHFMGKTGVFRAENMADEAERLFSSFAVTGGDFKGGMRRYLALVQEARKVTGSGAQAATAISGVQAAIRKNEDKFTAHGIAVKGEDGTMLPVVDIIMNAIEKSGGNTGVMKKMGFGDVRAMNAFSTLQTAFNAAGGGSAGRQAMEKILQGDSSLDNASVDEMSKDAAQAMGTEANQFAVAVQSIRATISDKLGPLLEKFAEKLPVILNGFTRAVEFVEKNPALSMGAAVVAGAGYGAFSSAARGMANSAGRYLADISVNTVPRLVPGAAGKVLSRVGSAVGGSVSAATATPVYVVNMPSGGFGDAPGVPPAPGVPGVPAVPPLGSVLPAVGAGAGIALLAAILASDSMATDGGAGGQLARGYGKKGAADKAFERAMEESRDSRREQDIAQKYPGLQVLAHPTVYAMTGGTPAEAEALSNSKARNLNPMGGGLGALEAKMGIDPQKIAAANDALDAFTMSARKANNSISQLKAPPLR